MNDFVESLFWLLILAALVFAGVWTYWQYMATTAYFHELGFWEWLLLRSSIRIIPNP